jgi:hypothetical protein
MVRYAHHDNGAKVNADTAIRRHADTALLAGLGRRVALGEALFDDT